MISDENLKFLNGNFMVRICPVDILKCEWCAYNPSDCDRKIEDDILEALSELRERRKKDE